jgi:hypothetical protein
MKIEPNSDIGMMAEVMLVHKGKIEFTDGESCHGSDLKNETSLFDEFCQKLDPNTTFIDVLMPDPDDRETFFLLKDKGSKYEIHVQNVLLRENEVWERWEYFKMLNKKS